MGSDNLLPDFRKAAKFRKSWSACVPGFEEILQKLRQEVPPKESDSCQLINVSSGKYVYRCNISGWDFAYKTQQGKTPWRYICRPSLPLRECLHYEVLQKFAIPIPQILAVGDTRKNFVLKESFIITGFLDNTADGRIFMPGGKFRTGCEELRRAYCIENLKLLARLHNAGYFHKAAHPRNFLFRGDSPENLEVFWIDVARMRKMHSPRRSVTVDLHVFLRDMNLPRQEVEELLEIYFQELKRPLFDSAQEILHELINFKRRMFSKKKYRLFSDL